MTEKKQGSIYQSCGINFADENNNILSRIFLYEQSQFYKLCMYVHIRIKKKTYSRTLLSKIRCNNKQQDIYYKNCRGKYLPCNKYTWKVKFIVSTFLYPIYHWTSLKLLCERIFLVTFENCFNKHIRRSLGKPFIVQNEISAIHHLTIQIYCLIFYEKILLCGDVV